jgi:hypothetical protein
MFILKSEAYIYKHNIEHELINRFDILKTDQLTNKCVDCSEYKRRYQT